MVQTIFRSPETEPFSVSGHMKVRPSGAAAINDRPSREPAPGLVLDCRAAPEAGAPRVHVHPRNRSERESRSTAHRDQNSERCDRSLVNKGFLRPGHRRCPPSLGRLLAYIFYSKRPSMVLRSLVCIAGVDEALRSDPRLPHSIFFTSKLIFEHDNWYIRQLHSEAALTLLRRLHMRNIPMIVLPMKL